MVASDGEAFLCSSNCLIPVPSLWLFVVLFQLPGYLSEITGPRQHFHTPDGVVPMSCIGVGMFCHHALQMFVWSHQGQNWLSSQLLLFACETSNLYLSVLPLLVEELLFQVLQANWFIALVCVHVHAFQCLEQIAVTWLAWWLVPLLQCPSCFMHVKPLPANPRDTLVCCIFASEACS